MDNKRVRSRRPKTARDLLPDAASQAPENPRRLTRRKQDIDQRIHRLECFIAAAPSAMGEQRLRTRDTLPPPDELWSRSRRAAAPAAKRRVPLQRQRVQQTQRILLLVQLAVVTVLIAGLAGWMRQWLSW